MTDHEAVGNHTIVWEGVKLPAQDPDWTKRGIREAICIRKAGPHAINRDEGCHHLPDVYSKLPLPHLVVAIRSTEDEA